MMETRMMERLRFRPHEENTEGGPARGFRWYPKTFLVAVLALLLMSAASMSQLNEAKATDYDGYYENCYWTYNHYTGQWFQHGCVYYLQGSWIYQDYNYGLWIYTNAGWVDYWEWVRQKNLAYNSAALAGFMNDHNNTLISTWLR